MKTIKAPLLSIAFVVLNVFTVLSNSEHPPAPPQNASRSQTARAQAGPVEPGIPINQNIVFLLMAGTALGITVIYKNKIKKASV